MRTTLQIPDHLLKQASRLAKAKTKTETVVIALQDYVRMKKIEKLIAAAGTVRFQEGYDWNQARHGR